MDFDTHARKGLVQAAPAPLARGPSSSDADGLAESHGVLVRSTAAGAVERVIEVDAQAQSLAPEDAGTFFGRLFASKEQRAALAKIGAMGEVEADARLRMLKLHRAVEHKLVRDGLEEVRVRFSSQLRAITAARVLTELDSLIVRFSRLSDDAYARAAGRISEAERLPYETLRVRVFDEIIADLDSLTGMRAHLIKQFEEIVQDQLES